MNFLALVFRAALLERHELARGLVAPGPGQRAISPTGLFTTIVFLRYLDGPAQSIFGELETEGMVPVLTEKQ